MTGPYALCPGPPQPCSHTAKKPRSSRDLWNKPRNSSCCAPLQTTCHQQISNTPAVRLTSEVWSLRSICTGQPGQKTEEIPSKYRFPRRLHVLPVETRASETGFGFRLKPPGKPSGPKQVAQDRDKSPKLWATMKSNTHLSKVFAPSNYQATTNFRRHCSKIHQSGNEQKLQALWCAACYLP